MDTGTDIPPLPDKDEISTFREDYRQLEADIQSYFRAYYLSGIAGFLAWLLGTKSGSAIEVLIGNHGYNIYALMAIGLLNMVTTTFLLYKGIAIHEIAQFMSWFSPSDSAFNAWERWRRGPQSITRYVRVVYSILLVAVPLATSALILSVIRKTLYTPTKNLVDPLNAAQLASVFETAKYFFKLLLGLHLIPLWGVIVSIFFVPRSWRKLARTRISTM